MTRHRTSGAPPSPSTAGTFARTYARVVAGRRTKWAVLVLWVLLIGVGGSLAAKLGDVQNNEAETWLPTNAQATRAVKIAEDYFQDKGRVGAVVVYAREDGLTDVDLAKVNADRQRFVANSLAAADVPPVTVAADRKAAFLSVPVKSDQSDNSVLGDGVKRLRDAAGQDAPAGLDVKIAGQAGNIADFIDVYSGMDGALMAATLGLVAVFLLFTYRSPILWLIPLLSVGLASQVASAVVYLLAKHAGLTVNGQSAYVLVVLVLGVGTDYALLLIARYREELHRQEDRHEAMEYALRRCLPAITASAATVGIATICLVFGSMNSTRGLGPVVALGVVIVYFAMTTLLPAFLVVLGRWVFWPFTPRYSADHVDSSAEKEHGFWARVSGFVGRRPRPIWIGATLVLVALAFGAMSLSTGQTQAEQFTKKVDSVAGQDLIARHFPAGSSAPADVYVKDGGATAALAVVQQVPGITSASTIATKNGWTRIEAVLKDAPDTQAARSTVEHLRTALASNQGEAKSAVVGGQTAVALDTSDAQSEEEKLLIPLILAVVLIMLIILLRALTAPLVLLLSVVLSYTAAVGSAALLFHAVGHPRIDRGLLLFGFLFLVALGVDYTIFLMTRAREEVGKRGHRDGVLTSLTVTGGVITSAGLVLAATFSVLAAIPTVASLQQGLLVAVGILLDTFIVRSLLIPALALELGPRFWRPGHPERAKADRSIVSPAEPARLG
ncbi:RND superfamily putative drug exporter [Kribbella voronezhensis]|uniref:RND superfamily putative drug exporter n=1 Tax=Kribbella voronezhensis TaxID=2512212 RepID=A0A4R7TFC8_9ACTN|nr:MMPL family transporter [Kribbella voronezhensis]TDU90117.1 RND superfamily putative drug exporter [Kribbella voronezhensis]